LHNFANKQTNIDENVTFSVEVVTVRNAAAASSDTYHQGGFEVNVSRLLLMQRNHWRTASAVYQPAQRNSINSTLQLLRWPGSPQNNTIHKDNVPARLSIFTASM